MLSQTDGPDVDDAPELPRSLREAEAEAVVYILATLLELPGRESACAYIQSWLEDGAIPERGARRIFSGAQEILAAGRANTSCPEAA